MKAFFEEYGFVLVSIVVVMLLVGMTSSVGNSVQGKLTDAVEKITFDGANAQVKYDNQAYTPASTETD